jgi:hypothetical protein
VVAVEKFGECDTRDGSTRLHFWRTAPRSGPNDAAEPRLLGDEHDAFAWVSVEEMRRLEPVFQEDVEIFARLVARGKLV